MKALIALALVVASFAHAEDAVKITPACTEAAKATSTRLEVLNTELKRLEKLKFKAVEKRSIAYAIGANCYQVYFQNYLTRINDGLLDWRRELTPINAEIKRISDQNFAKYWAVHAKESWDGLMTFGQGRVPKRLIPETKSTYLAHLNEARKEKMDNLNWDKAELARVTLDSQRISMMTGDQFQAEALAAESEMNQAAWEIRHLIQNEISSADRHTGCSSEEVKAVQLKQFEDEENGARQTLSVFDRKSLESLLSSLTKTEDLDRTASNIRSGGCQVRDSYYSGERAALLKGVKLEE